MTNIITEHELNRALFFLTRNTPIHVKKKNGIFHNGIILEVGTDFLILKDRVDGKEYLIFFGELEKPIDIYKERGENEIGK